MTDMLRKFGLAGNDPWSMIAGWNLPWRGRRKGRLDPRDLPGSLRHDLGLIDIRPLPERGPCD